MAKYHTDCHEVLREATVFPIEVDLNRGTFTYDNSHQFDDGGDDSEEEVAEEVREDQDVNLISTD